MVNRIETSCHTLVTPARTFLTAHVWLRSKARRGNFCAALTNLGQFGPSGAPWGAVVTHGTGLPLKLKEPGRRLVRRTKTQLAVYQISLQGITRIENRQPKQTSIRG